MLIWILNEFLDVQEYEMRAVHKNLIIRFCKMDLVSFLNMMDKSVGFFSVYT